MSARRIVGRRVSSSMHTEFVLDAVEQALYARRAEREGRASIRRVVARCSGTLEKLSPSDHCRLLLVAQCVHKSVRSAHSVSE
jgi:hypothetical protein